MNLDTNEVNDVMYVDMVCMYVLYDVITSVISWNSVNLNAYSVVPDNVAWSSKSKCWEGSK